VRRTHQQISVGQSPLLQAGLYLLENVVLAVYLPHGGNHQMLAISQYLASQNASGSLGLPNLIPEY
jgi:hypothetical protein